MKSLSGSDLLKYACLPSFLAFFNLSICIFFSLCNSFGISSNILKFVSLSLRPHLTTRSLSEYLKKRAITVRLPFTLPLLGFPILCTRWNSMPFASSIPRASSIKLTRTFSSLKPEHSVGLRFQTIPVSLQTSGFPGDCRLSDKGFAYGIH